MKKFLLKFTPLILISFLILEIILTIFSPIWVEKYYADVPNTNILFYILLYLSGAIIAYMLMNCIFLSKILIDYRFEIKYINYLRRINYGLLTIIFIVVLIFLLTHLLSFIIIDFSLIVLLCLLVAVQEAFKSAVKLQTEVDHTI